MSNRYAPYTRLGLEYPSQRILRLTFNRPETYNSVDAETHTQLTNISKARLPTGGEALRA
jgi:enoyl-CoA hydratase